MTQANRVTFASIAACVFGLAGTTQPAEPARRTFDKNSPYYFDGTISRQTLEHYLDRAITMGYFLVPGQPEGYQFPYRDDDVRMIHNLGVGESGTGPAFAPRLPHRHICAVSTNPADTGFRST
jgi:hypothetical protein